VRPGLGQIAGLVLAILLLAVFFWWADLPQTLQILGGASVPLLLASMALQVLHLMVRALRWRILLSPVKERIGFYNLFSTTVIGYMASTLFPFRVGEILRPLMLAGRERISRGAALATIGVERILDILLVVLFLGAYLMLFADDLGSAALGSEAWARTIAAARVAGAVLLAALPALVLFARFGEGVLQRLERRLAPGGTGGASRVLRAVGGLTRGMGVLTDPVRLGQSLVTSLLVWLVIAASTWVGVLAMRPEYPFPFRATLLLVPLLAVGVSTPSPGGAGGYHIICGLALEQLFGAPHAEAAATAIVLWFLSVVPMVLLGAYFLWRAGIPIHHLGRLARSSPEDDAAEPGGITRGERQ
jgi:glycosyltransferase 2 family protein